MPALSLRQGLKPLLCVLVTLVFVACASVPNTGVQPVKSANDDYQYRLLTLDNEMQVLLISAPGSPKAAASLDVMAGSGDNPAQRQGLAHFLEHMLFLGTDKYPDPAEYEQYITEHGGTRNAYTSFNDTNYFFDVNAAYLPEALDRFAQFFIAPRFDTAYVDREKKAVEAEYQMGLKSDPRRGLDVLQEVMNPGHPFSQFTVGSLDTLADRPGSEVRDELISFYKQHYSANRMHLTVLGSQNLDELETLVVPMFTPVPNREAQANDITAPMFTPGSLPMLVKIQPQATQRQLEVSFPIPDFTRDYRVKPTAYLSNLVGHEGEGSLLSSLKKEGLAESLSAGAGLQWRGGALFSVGISLTEQGVVDHQRVLQLLFAYLDMLRGEGAREWLYDEQSQLADLNFRFREKIEPINYVSGLSRGMQQYAPDDILRGPYIMDQYDKRMLDDLLQRLTLDNALIVLTDKNVKTDRVSNYYQVPYSRHTLSGDQLAALQGEGKPGELHLPAPNQFIAEDVSLVALGKDNPPIPAIALRKERQQIWFMQDAEFRVPKGATYLNFRSPEVGQTPQQTAAAVLYAALLKDNVNEFAYPAMLAGLSFDIYKHAQGISLRITGYNDKQAVLLEQLLAVIAEPAFDPARFENIRLDMIRSLQNSVADRPSSQVMSDLREALLYGEWGEQALIGALQQLDLAGLQDYANRFWAGATVEAMIYGNYSPDDVQRLSDMVAGILSTRPQPELPDLKVLQLAAGESLLYQVDVPHDDSVVAWYLQGAGNSWKDRGATALTAQIIKSGFFQQLRTEQQLGYVVAAFPWPQMEVPGLVMLIQSPVADAGTVEKAMQEFMSRVPEELDQAQFARHQEALVQEILRPDKNLWERAGFYWQSIAMKQPEFDGRQQLAAAVEGFDLQSWLGYYRQVFQQQRHSLQVIAPGRWGSVPQGEFQHYDSATGIKDGHRAYTIN
jgi:insulysin